MAATHLQDTVLLLLSDHGTHGIWYTDYEIGATEHQLPFFYLLAPDWLLRERPQWRDNLVRNTKRLVTAHEVYRSMSTLAAYPHDAPDDERGLTIFDEISEQRTCKDAGVPETYCACRREGAL